MRQCGACNVSLLVKLRECCGTALHALPERLRAPARDLGESMLREAARHENPSK